MKRKSIFWWSISGAMLIFSGMACIEKPAVKNPPGYDLGQPVKYNMPDALLEISGIAFHHGNADSVYAEQDEDGRIYYLKLGDKKASYSKFGAHGDYEDIAIMGEQVFILRSDGVLFTFPFNEVRSGDIKDVYKIGGMLPKGEYEGMYADQKTKEVFVLCKTCKDDDTKNFITGHVYTMVSGFPKDKIELFKINLKEIEAKSGKNKMSFHPSALTKNPRTNEWYILSSVNKLLVVADASWKVKAAYPLDPSLFIQPEGIAFDNQSNLYISNEGDKLTPGTILKFNYKK